MTTITGRIYKITNPNTTSVFIGSTIQKLGRALSNHKSKARQNDQTKFHISMKELDPDTFTIELIEETTLDNLETRKYEIISTFPEDQIFNTELVKGERSLLTRAKIETTQEGRKVSAETRAKLSKSRGGCIYERKDNSFRYTYIENGKRKSKSFSYGVKSKINRTKALMQAREFQKATFPDAKINPDPYS